MRRRRGRYSDSTPKTRGESMATKKGKVKLTKADKARLKKEEEERRLQEEEEARLQAERDEEERQKREKEEEVMQELELKDLERRETELEELRNLLEDNHNAVVKWKTEEAEKAKWERYMRCDGTPDPYEQREINTYISLWREDPEVDVTKVLQQCMCAVQLMDELEELHKESSSLVDIKIYQEAITTLIELIHLKHNLATEEIVKEASASIDTDSGNMLRVNKDEHATLCLWGNLRKNPRFRSLLFEEVDLGCEIPKQLAISSIVIRILHTRYDHLTLLARMVHTGRSAPSSRSLAGGGEVAPADMVLPEPEETIVAAQVKEDSDRQEPAQKDEPSGPKSAGRKSSSGKSLHSTETSDHPTESRNSQIQTQIEALNGEGESSSSLSHLITTEKSFKADVVDLMQYTPLGGVFYFDAFHLPPQPCTSNGWTIRETLKGGLQVFNYPQKDLQMNESSSSELDEGLGSSLLGVSVTIPEDVIFLETPQVGLWDAAEKQWRMDGVSNVSYSEDKMKITFKMDCFQPFVLIQDTYANFPFQSWQLKPLGQDSAVFTVKGALLNITITIQGNLCMLEGQEESRLSHIAQRWMSYTALQKAMQKCGVNIFVNELTEKYVRTYGKDPLLEHSAYEQMALFSSSCAFMWSKWNAQCGAEHLVMQVCEHLAPTPLPQNQWSLYLLGAQRCQKMEISEASETFSPDHIPGTEFHSTFIHMLQDHMSAEAIARTRESSNLFIDTVQSLLCGTRPLVFS